MEMPTVVTCEVEECAYNIDKCCHTMAITVGDSSNPRCDTFCKSNMQGGDNNIIAGVGSCKVSCCSHNANLECGASEITVGYQSEQPDCMTFEAC